MRFSVPKWSPLESALTLLIIAATIPATLCTFELSRLDQTIAGINEAASQAKEARRVVDLAGQSIINVTAMTLHLSEEELTGIRQKTDQHLQGLQEAFRQIEPLARLTLSAEEYASLNQTLAAVTHNWSEIRDQAQDGMAETERTFHFLKVLDDSLLIRSLLNRVEASATQIAEDATATSLARVGSAEHFLSIALALGAVLSLVACQCMIRFGKMTREANQKLLLANEELSLRDARLVEQNLRFDAALNNMVQGLCMYDGLGRLVLSNKRFCVIFGYPEALMPLGAEFRSVLETIGASAGLAEVSAKEAVEERLALVSRGEAGTLHQRLADGRTVLVTHVPMPGGGWVETYEDITDRQRAEARIAHMAQHDALTGLPNRVRFREALDQVLPHTRRGRACAILCLDLDHFKCVNDTLGHPVGDALLRLVSERIRSCVRETDTVARLGGDEFAVLQVSLEGVGEATALAQRLVDALSAPYELEGHLVVIGTSVGIALAPADSDDPDQLIKYADMALYRAKADGRGTYRLFDAAMDARMQARRRLETDLRAALIHGEFELHYQPVVEAATCDITGFEALIRWRHPKRGMVSPADFIPLAEETGLIVPIGEWVLRRACAEAAGWPAHVKVAVNLSPVQFKVRGLVDTVTSALAAGGLTPARLELEITESVMLQDTEQTLATLDELRRLGVHLSLDDFGTGYSSLSYLQKFPFNKLKIDQGFVRDMAARSDCAAIVRAVAEMGAKMRMTVVAEGVETLEQLNQLRADGCAQVQGYFFSRPEPSAEIARMLLRPGLSAVTNLEDAA